MFCMVSWVKFLTNFPIESVESVTVKSMLNFLSNSSFFKKQVHRQL